MENRTRFLFLLFISFLFLFFFVRRRLLVVLFPLFARDFLLVLGLDLGLDLDLVLDLDLDLDLCLNRLPPSELIEALGLAMGLANAISPVLILPLLSSSVVISSRVVCPYEEVSSPFVVLL